MNLLKASHISPAISATARAQDVKAASGKGVHGPALGWRSSGALTELSQLPLSIVSGLGHATDDTACEWPLSSCLEASTKGAEGTAAPAAPFFLFAPVSCLAGAASSSLPLSATADPTAGAAVSSIPQCHSEPTLQAGQGAEPYQSRMLTTFTVNDRVSHRPVGQMRRLLSQLALTRRAPSGLTAMPVTASVCSLHRAGICQNTPTIHRLIPSTSERSYAPYHKKLLSFATAAARA